MHLAQGVGEGSEKQEARYDLHFFLNFIFKSSWKAFFLNRKFSTKKDSSLKILKNQDQFEDPQLLKRKVSVVRVTPVISPYFCGTQQMIQ